jgi:hypothetical protein
MMRLDARISNCETILLAQAQEPASFSSCGAISFLELAECTSRISICDNNQVCHQLEKTIGYASEKGSPRVMRTSTALAYEFIPIFDQAALRTGLYLAGESSVASPFHFDSGMDGRGQGK